MEIKIERIEDLFDEDIVNEMLSFVEEKGCCHFNSAMVCVNFDDWKCIDYVLKDKAPQYMKDHWDYFLSLVEDEWGTAEIENPMKQCVN